MTLDYSFTANDLTAMREAQDGHMLDTGNVQTVTLAIDSFGQQTETYSSNESSIVCGLDMRPGQERHGIEKVIVEYDATVRLPIGTTVSEDDRFRVTKRFGETLATALVFDIVSPIQRGPSGIRLMLRKRDV